MEAEAAAADTAHLVDGIDAQLDETEDFQPIENLEKLGINRGDIKKAKEGGFHTCLSILMQPKKKLCNIKGLSEAKVEKLVEAAKKSTRAGWISATDVASTREREVVKISLGAEAVNTILGGGIETKSITEFYGEYRTGKTQLCLTLCVTSQMPTEMGGGAGKVAFIDTEGTFRPERIRPIAERFNLDADAVLGNIVVARSYTHEHQMELLTGVAALMADDVFKVLIIDSIMGNFRVDFSGRGELAERQQKLGTMLATLKKISEEFNVAVVITNHVISDPGGGAMFVSDPKKPIGGHVLAHAVTTRISLRKGKAEQRVMKLVDSPWLPEAEASFALSNDGVVDYKD